MMYPHIFTILNYLLLIPPTQSLPFLFPILNFLLVQLTPMTYIVNSYGINTLSSLNLFSLDISFFPSSCFMPIPMYLNPPFSTLPIFILSVSTPLCSSLPHTQKSSKCNNTTPASFSLSQQQNIAGSSLHLLPPNFSKLELYCCISYFLYPSL